MEVFFPTVIDKFEINQDTGDIKFLPNVALDRETEAQLTLQVIAKDKGEPPKDSLPKTVVITVEDINDNGPIFTAFNGGDYVFTTHQV